ncbi:DNA-binding response regulator [Arthrobacter pityocampae]|uniref:DNA-binding response regulator n=1 Tax=Arthrobacter pityocampae TaxID=547334 RepID=A0A2S5IV00_9MICC|nr:response regulator transcription factor [Arthrobacter pityocampae]PPB48388.1 DNA-binding response regulator [Arthrobacter pityocampae]
MNSLGTDATGRPSRRVRVFIGEEHELVRQGLSDLLEDQGCEVVGGSGSAVEASREVAHLRPDVVILDHRLADGTGPEVCRTIRSIDPGIRCVMLTSFDDEAAVRSTILAGACGYLLKEVGNDRLIRGVRRAAVGETLLAPGTINRARERLSWMLSDRPALFTPVEGQVASGIIAGMSNREIGASWACPTPSSPVWCPPSWPPSTTHRILHLEPFHRSSIPGTPSSAGAKCM